MHHPSPVPIIIILSYYYFHFFQQTPIHHSCVCFRSLYTFPSFVALYIAGGSSIGLFRPISGDMEYCGSHQGRGIEHKPRKKFTKPERGNGTIRKFFVLYKDREQGSCCCLVRGGKGMQPRRLGSADDAPTARDDGAQVIGRNHWERKKKGGAPAPCIHTATVSRDTTHDGDW